MPDSHLYLTLRLGGLPHYAASPTMRLCTTDGVAFAWLSSHSLVEYLGRRLTVEDSAGRQAIGYIKEADAAEALVERIVDGDCSTDSFTKGAGWTYDAGNQEYDGAPGTGNLTQAVGVVGKLYKFTETTKNYIAGFVQLAAGTSYGSAWTGDGINSAYSTCLGNTSLGLRKNTAANLSVDDIKAEEVTHVGTDGVHIVSALGGATRNWTSIDSGFDPNDVASVTVH